MNNVHPILQAALASIAPRELSTFELVQEAFDSAADAAFAYLGQYGDNADCGGAWIVVPGRSAVATHCRKHGIGFKQHGRGGWAIPVCTGLRCQSRIIYEKAADAFVKVLRINGHEAYVYSYAD